MQDSAHTSPGLHAAARDAVIEYARHHARLPPFPSRRASQRGLGVDEREVEPTVARLVACGVVKGQVLPRTADVWLALLPFNDLVSGTLDEYMRDLLLRRVRFMSLLARYANSSFSPLDPTIDCVNANAEHPAQSFWLELLRVLDPEAVNDTMKNLERDLVALSRGSKLRILVRIETDPRQGVFIQSLSTFFHALEDLELGESDREFISAMKLCSVPELAAVEPIEIGFQFAHGTMTKAAMTTLLHHIVKLPKSSHFRVTCLRFGPCCTLQTMAVEVLGDRLEMLGIDTLQLGCSRDVRPASLRRCLASVPASVHRLITTDQDENIEALASMARCSSPSMGTLREVDVQCTPSLDMAAWLAYGFFHVDSDSSVSSLCMRMPADCDLLSDGWIDTFKRVLTKVTPEEDLAGMEIDDEGSAQSATMRIYVKLIVNTTVKSQPYSGVKALYKILASDAEVKFEKIASAGKHIAVVIPCIGVGWVPEACVLEEHDFPSRLGGYMKINGRITSLTWVGCLSSVIYQDTSYFRHTQVLLEFLSIVGEPLTSLSLPDMNLSTDDLHKIMRYCPNLTLLNISYNDNCDLSPIVEAFESGNCKLESLSIERRCLYREESAIVQQMTRILTSKGERESKLTQISMDVIQTLSDVRRPFFENQLLSLVSIMNTIRRLDFVQLRGHRFWSVVDPQGRSAPLDFSDTAEGLIKLPLRSKLAFLSVVQCPQNNVWCNLDASVISLIFQFGRSRVTRHALLLP